MSHPSLESPASPGVWQSGSRAPAPTTLPGTEKTLRWDAVSFESLLQPTQRTRVLRAVSDRSVRRGTQVWTVLGTPVHSPLPHVRPLSAQESGATWLGSLTT